MCAMTTAIGRGLNMASLSGYCSSDTQDKENGSEARI